MTMKDPRVIEAIQYMMSKGYSMLDAVAIVSNLYSESNLSTTATNQGHVGAAQWDSKRQADFRMVQGKRVEDASLHEQLDFVDWELKNTEAPAGDALRLAKDLHAKVAAIHKRYERPGDADPTLPTRQNNASFMLQNMPLTSRDPNLASTQDNSKQVSVEQTNHVTIDGSGASPDEIARAWRAEHERSWGTLLRNQNNALR